MTETGGDFKTGLCGCCSVPKTACLSWCIPCYVHGKNAESVNLPIPLLGEGKGLIVHLLTYFVPCLDIYQIAKSREMVRNQNDIQGSFAKDCGTACCCSCCALAQIRITLDANIAALAAPEAVEAVDPTAEQEIERE